MRNWPEDIWLSLNLSCHDIISPDTVASLITSIVESGIAPSRISLEITETALLQEFDTAAQHIGQLKAKGIKIALDDFGTGYSSLSHVNTLPLDKLKIDRSFVDKLDSNRNGQNIVRSVISLCRDMGMDCIVEGAETEAEVAVLMQMGCRDIQGYYYARPMPASDIGAFLKDQKSSAEIMSGQNRQDQLLTSDT
jgi:predicted signal transduction protein with EAL and GGDEF domain